jgi:sugar phosphate isomerase/epimerase
MDREETMHHQPVSRQTHVPAGWQRRHFLKTGVQALSAAWLTGHRLIPADASPAQATGRFSLRYLLASCLYGYASLEEILREVRKAGAEAIDLWPKVHGNQREQLDTLGLERFQELLTEHGVRLGAISRYDLGPFRLADEIRLAGRLGCPVIVTGAAGPVGLKNAELRQAVRDFVEKLKPTLALAEESGVIIAIENHGSSLIESPDAMRWLAESWPTRTLSLAFAPYHLPQDANLLARLIRDLGEKIAVFYMWQHGKGCMKPMPLEDELLQLPGRGPLDFRPILSALKDIHYSGYSSIFMHAYPRGRPIRDTPALVTAHILEAREYLERCLTELA